MLDPLNEADSELFVQVCARPHTYLCEDEMDIVQHIPQGEGGE